MFAERHRRNPELLKRRKGRPSKRLGTKSTIVYVSRKRADRTAAQIRVLALLFSRCSLQTMEVGQWSKDDGEIQPIDLRHLAIGSGLSRWRLDRAISDLLAAGYIYRHQSRDAKPDGKGGYDFTGHVAILKLTRSAFQAFGVSGERLDVFRRRAQSERLRKADKRDRRAGRSQHTGSPEAVGQLIAQILAPSKDRPLSARVLDRDRAAWNNLCWKLREAQPDLPAEEVYRRVFAQLYPTGVPDG